MPAQPSYRLDARTGWRLLSSKAITWSGGAARLAQRPGAIRPLDAPGGDLGGRALPRRVALGLGGQIYLITTDGALVWYDPCQEFFAPVPCGRLGRIGLSDPIALAVSDDPSLLVLDGTTRMITALSLADWRVARQWGPFDTDGVHLSALPATPLRDPLTGAPTGALDLPGTVWDPRDIAVLPSSQIAVSDRASGQIAYFDRRGCLLGSSDGATSEQGPLQGPDALAVDAQGALFVLEADTPALARLDHQGRIVARSENPDDLPETIEDGHLTVDGDGTIWVSNRLPGAARAFCCDPSGRIASAAGSALVPPECDLLAFDHVGRAIVSAPDQPCLRRADAVARFDHGALVFGPLDGGRAATQWDRIRFAMTIPEGCSATLLVRSSDAMLDQATIAAMPRAAWAAVSLDTLNGKASAAILAPPGRYLWMQLEFGGDGAATPRLDGLTVSYPRRTSARHLPAVWSAEPKSADFLARFMMLFDELRADTLEPLDSLAGLIDPLATQAAEAGAHGADFLDWLGGWIGLALDRNWSVERRRRLVAEAPKLFPIKGTIEGLSRHVEIYSGITPKIVEHYKLRRWITLDETTLDGAAALWGPELIRRLSLDDYAEIGRFRLVDGGNPLTDEIAAFAHRATVFVPVAEAFSRADLAALEATVAAARPAHVDVDVRVMKSGFVMGCDTLLGVNTVLNRHHETAVLEEAVLGDDIRLDGPPHPFSLGPSTRLGPDTTLE
ncbi:MAG: phage tail protein [Yoonia sp.]